MENDDEYDPNEDEDEAILAAPLAKLNEIKQKKKQILTQTSGSANLSLKKETENKKEDQKVKQEKVEAKVVKNEQKN